MTRESSFILMLFLPLLAYAQDSIVVETNTPEQVLITRQLRAPADVRTLNQATISAEVPAVISKIHVDVGQLVAKGNTLVELDDTDYQLRLRQALASLEASHAQKIQADARLNRARELDDRKFLSADDLLARETELSVAKAQIRIQEVNVAKARRQLAKCIIPAPFTGVVSERYAQLGSYVGPGTPLLDLTETDRFEIDAEIPASLADTLIASPDIRYVNQKHSWPASLLRLSPVIDPERRTRRARLEFTGLSAPVGSSGELVWLAGNSLLPANLLVRRNGQLGIFLFEHGRAVFLPIENAQEGRPVAVSLPADTRIIVRGRDRLQPGDLVSVSQP